MSFVWRKGGETSDVEGPDQSVDPLAIGRPATSRPMATVEAALRLQMLPWFRICIGPGRLRFCQQRFVPRVLSFSGSQSWLARFVAPGVVPSRSRQPFIGWYQGKRRPA